jgi:hypothetical protein
MTTVQPVGPRLCLDRHVDSCVAVFFASNDALLVTGQLIAVDGSGVMPS